MLMLSNERVERAERAERAEWAERAERAERAEQAERAESQRLNDGKSIILKNLRLYLINE